MNICHACMAHISMRMGRPDVIKRTKVVTESDINTDISSYSGDGLSMSSDQVYDRSTIN